MRAWRFHGFGDMRLHELPDPTCGPYDALVRVRVVQPSVTEAVLALGGETFGIEEVRAQLRDPPAALFGHEYCAEVVSVGDAVAGLRPGMRVADVASLPCLACPLCREGRRDDCRRGPHVGWDLPGCLSDVAVVPARGLVAVPDAVPDREAACLQPAADCVAAVEAARIEPGARVAVIGQGPMGAYALQLSRSAGAAQVVAIDVRPAPLAIARGLGADETLDATEVDVVAAVRELTGGRGVDVAIESAGGPPERGLAGSTTLEQALDVTRDTGRVVALAMVAGRTPLDLLRWRSRAVELIFPPLGAPRHLRRAAELTATRELRLDRHISHTVVGLERVPEAFEITANKARYGALGPCQAVIANGGAT